MIRVGNTCRKCGVPLATRRRVCANCTDRDKRLKIIFFALILVQGVIIGNYLLHNKKAMPHVADDSVAPVVAATAGATGWFYYQTRDALVDDTMRHARVLSASATVNAGNTTSSASGMLELRNSKIYGRSVVFTVQREAADHAAETCRLAIKFDNGPVLMFAALESASRENYIIVVNETDQFIGLLHNAKVMAVDAFLAKQTEHVLYFTVAGLDWT